MRKCSCCRAPVYGCNSFVKAGDLIEFEDGKRKGEDIRELCGKCGLPPIITEVQLGRDLTEDELRQFAQRVGFLDPSTA